MSVQIRLYQGTTTPTLHTIDKQFVSVGSAPHCELHLDQPGIPDVACLLEYDAGQNMVYVHGVKADMLLLDNKRIAGNAKVPWSARQELRIGVHCRLLLSPEVTSAPANNDTRPTEAANTKKTVTAGRTESPRPGKQPQPSKGNAADKNPELPEESFDDTKKKQSQMIQVAIIALCGIGCVAMPFMGRMPDVTQKKPVELKDVYDRIQSVRGHDKATYDEIWDRLHNTYTMKGNDQRAAYFDLKLSIQKRKDESTSKDPELDKLDKLLLSYINQQILRHQPRR